MNTNIGTGFLKVKVTAAREALPIEGATVRISISDENENGVMYSLRTDISGETETVPLPAPPASTAASPTGVRPYALYNAEITKEDYYTVMDVKVPVFDGVVSILPVSFVPMGEFEAEDTPENTVYNYTPENELYKGDNNG